MHDVLEVLVVEDHVDPARLAEAGISLAESKGGGAATMDPSGAMTCIRQVMYKTECPKVAAAFATVVSAEITALVLSFCPLPVL